MSGLFLGIDIGTASSKAVLVDAAGAVVDSASVSHEISMPGNDRAEFDAVVGWDEVAALSREILGRNPAVELAGVCVSAMGPCLVLTDDSLTPLRPTILYGIDARAAAEIDELNARYGAEAIFADCGKTLTSQAVGPKLRWVANHEPEVFARATRWHSLSSYLVAKLTDEHVMDHHTASQCDPMYSVRNGAWDEKRASEIAGHLATPRLAWPSEVVGAVTDEAAAATGIPAGVPVCAGTVDAWAEAFSVGVRRPGDLMLMYGSTMFFVEVLEDFVSHRQLWTTNGIEQGTLSIAAGMSTSGSLTTWMQKLFGDVPFDTLVREAAEKPAGSDGLLVLPYFAGERTPVFDPDARGIVMGLSLRHDRGHLFRATYEGIAFGIRQIVELLESVGRPVANIRAVGGGTRSALWTQIVSDVTGREQAVPEQTIGASYGDALLAAIGTGAVAPHTDWTKAASVIRPDPANAARYEELYSTYCELYPANREYLHVLARIQAS